MARRRAVKVMAVFVGLALGALQQAAQGFMGTLGPASQAASPSSVRPENQAPRAEAAAARMRGAHPAVAPASAPDGASDLDLVISSRITTAPSYVTSVVRPRPNPDNRLLRVTIDAPGFTRTSAVALDGQDAPANCHFYWRDLQPGLYNLVATVHDVTGAVLAHRRLTFAVVGRAPAE